MNNEAQQLSEFQQIMDGIPYREAALELVSGAEFGIGNLQTTYTVHARHNIERPSHTPLAIFLDVETANQAFAQQLAQHSPDLTITENSKIPIYLSDQAAPKPLVYTWYDPEKQTYTPITRLIHDSYAPVTERSKLLAHQWGPPVHQFMQHTAHAHGISRIIERIPYDAHTPFQYVQKGMHTVMKHFLIQCSTLETNDLLNSLFTYYQSENSTLKENTAFVPHLYSRVFLLFNTYLEKAFKTKAITPDVLSHIDWNSFRRTIRNLAIGITGALEQRGEELLESDLFVFKNDTGQFVIDLTESKREKVRETVAKQRRIAEGFQAIIHSYAQYQDTTSVHFNTTNMSSNSFASQAYCPVLPDWTHEPDAEHAFDILTNYAIAFYCHIYDETYIENHLELFTAKSQ